MDVVKGVWGVGDVDVLGGGVENHKKKGKEVASYPL
jgi:hypothetical protein